MAAVQYSECPIFPGEVEDYYCTTCHSPCSGLALLVGPHTGHNRVPLSQAVRFIPSALRRDAEALLAQINNEYVRPKRAHCATLQATLDHLQQEKQRKVSQLEELRCELTDLDEKIETTIQEQAMALCHWSRRRDALVLRTQQLLHGSTSLQKAVGLLDTGRSASTRGSSHNHASNSNDSDAVVKEAGDDLSAQALHTMARELHQVEQLLSPPLQWLEVEKGAQRDGHYRRHAEAVKTLTDDMDEEAMAHMRRVAVEARRPRRPSDAAAVMRDLLKSPKPPKGQPPQQGRGEERKYEDAKKQNGEKKKDIEEEEEMDKEVDNGELQARRQSWWRDVQRRERLLRDGLNECLTMRGASNGNTSSSSNNSHNISSHHNNSSLDHAQCAAMNVGMKKQLEECEFYSANCAPWDTESGSWNRQRRMNGS